MWPSASRGPIRCCKLSDGSHSAVSMIVSHAHLHIAVIRLQGELAVRKGRLRRGRRGAQQAHRPVRVQDARRGIAAAVDRLLS